MLFKRQVLEGIAGGKVTLAFRRWKRPQVRPGTRIRTALGAIRIGDVRLIQEASLKEDHALKAGFDNLAALKNDLREGEDRQLYSVEIAGLEEDVRALLRQDDKLDEGEARSLVVRLERWDRASQMDGYHWRILTEIAGKPGVPAAKIAELLKIEKMRFKRDVRKLKELGLTESLSVGYRLSPRGEAFLAATRRWLQEVAPS